MGLRDSRWLGAGAWRLGLRDARARARAWGEAGGGGWDSF